MYGDVYSIRQALRQQQERIDATREGGLRQLISMTVEGRPTGRVWGHNPLRPGPLDGQPEQRWVAIAEYSDGTRQEWVGPS